MWMYHSHSDETKDTWAGLMGGMIFTGRWVWAGVGGRGWASERLMAKGVHRRCKVLHGLGAVGRGRLEE